MEMFIVLFSSVMMLISGFFLNYMTNQYRKLFKSYQDLYYSDRVFSEELFRYILPRIMNEAIEKEDFETAMKCRDLLTELEERRNRGKNISG